MVQHAADRSWRVPAALPQQASGHAELLARRPARARGYQGRGGSGREDDRQLARRPRIRLLALEREACDAAGIKLEDFVVRSRGAPERETILDAKRFFERLHYPVLVHCKSGADRAGFMAALICCSTKIVRWTKP